MSATTHHLTALTRCARAGAHIRVTGPCVQDSVLVEGQLRTARFGLTWALQAAGITHVLHHEIGRGFLPGAARDAARTVLRRAAEQGAQQVGDVDSAAALDVADTTATLLANTEVSFAVVWHSPQALFEDRTQSALAALHRAVSGARDAACVPATGVAPPRNLLVVIQGSTELPRDLLEIDGLRRVSSYTPTEVERRRALELIGPAFYGADTLSPAGLSGALDALSRRTAGSPMVTLEQLRRVSHDRAVRVDAPRDLINALERPEPPVQRVLPADELRAFLEFRLIGQPHVIDAVVGKLAARAVPSTMYDPDGTTGRPLAFVMLGPPGCGKTDLARGIALLMYGSAEQMVTVYANALKQEHETSVLTGSAPGFVGYGDGRSIGERLAATGPCVLLIDEFDRGNRALLELLLSVFEDGRLPSTTGAAVDLRDYIVVLTSNVGSDELEAQLQQPGPVPDRAALEHVQHQALRAKLSQTASNGGLAIPALFSRVEPDALAYDILRAPSVGGLVRWFAGWVVQNGLSDWGAPITYDADGLTAVIAPRLGRDGTWDARAVRAHVQRQFHDPLRERVALGALPAGRPVHVSFATGRASFEDLAA